MVNHYLPALGLVQQTQKNGDSKHPFINRMRLSGWYALNGGCPDRHHVADCGLGMGGTSLDPRSVQEAGGIKWDEFWKPVCQTFQKFGPRQGRRGHMLLLRF